MSSHNSESKLMPPEPLDYEDLRHAILAARGENLQAVKLERRTLEALIELGILVHVGGGMIGATCHGERVYRQLQNGAHASELDLQPPRPVYASFI
jgi:hypothetical protein